MKPLKKVAIVAGEASGDILGAGLIKELKRLYPECEFVGIGGEKMLAQGFTSWFPMDRLAVMGLIEPLKRIFELLSIRKQLKKKIKALKPEVFIGIDSPDFNLNLEKYLRKSGIKTVHYVSPSVWAWRQGRIKNIKLSTDLMLCLFPFEQAFYEQHNVAVCCVGHPLADQLPLETDRVEARRLLGLDTNNIESANNSQRQPGKLVALLPGSRAAEVRLHTELFLQVANLCVQQDPSLEFIIPAANDAREKEIALVLKKFPHLKVYLQNGRSHEAMAAADVVLLASGTTALEAMLLKKPMVVAYRMSGLAFSILKRMVRTPFVSLPNLLAKKELVPERLQDNATPEKLGKELMSLLSRSHAPLMQEFLRLHNMLRRDASQVAAREVVNFLQLGNKD